MSVYPSRGATLESESAHGAGAAGFGTEQTGPPAAPAELSARDLSWGLHTRLQKAYRASMEALLDSFDPEKGAEHLIETLSVLHIQQACFSGLQALVDAEADASLPVEVRSSLGRMSRDVVALASRIDPALHMLGTAASAIQGTTLTESSSEGFFRNLADVIKPPASQVATVRLTEMLLPGYGQIAAGFWKLFQEQKNAAAGKTALEQFAEAFTKVIEAWEGVFDLAWDKLVVDVREASSLVLEKAYFFKRAESALKELSERLPGDNETAAQRMIQGFVDEWGPVPGIVHLVVRSYLPPNQIDVATAERWATKQLALYPQEVASYEDAADVALEQGDPGKALDLAERGLTLDPSHAGLRASKLEAVAWLGRVGEAAAVAESLGNDGYGHSAVMFNVRGFARAQQLGAANVALQVWLQTVADKPAARQELRQDAVLGTLIREGKIAIGGDRADEMRSIVQARLESDEAKRFLGPPPPSMLEHAKANFLELSPGEEILFFLDFTILTSGRKGFAITTERLQWQENFLDEVHRVRLRDVKPAEVGHKDDNVLFGSHGSMFVGSDIAEKVEQTVKDLIEHANRSVS